MMVGEMSELPAFQALFCTGSDVSAFSKISTYYIQMAIEGVRLVNCALLLGGRACHGSFVGGSL